MADRSEASVKARSKQPVKPPTRIQRLSSFISRILWWPLHVFRNIFIAVARSSTPPVVSISVFLLVVPLLLILSIAAGAYVWSSVAVSWEAPLYLQYGEGRPPFADVVLPSLSTSQPYDISLDLVVPATDTNYNLGNFMTTLTLATPSNRTLATIRRPAIVLPPKSVIAFLLSSPTTTALHLSLLQSYTFGTSSVIAKVELGRRDEWRTIGKGEGRELSVLSASVVGTVRHKGIHGLVSRYPLLSAVVASSTFLVIGLAFLFTQIFFLPAVQWKAGGDFEVPDSGVVPPAAEVKQEGGTERRLRKRPSLKGTRTSRRSHDSLGEEVPTTQMPAANTTDTPLRRRRSRLSLGEPESEQEL